MYTLDGRGRGLPKKLAGYPVEVKTAEEGGGFCWYAVRRIRRRAHGQLPVVHRIQASGCMRREAAGDTPQNY